MSSSRTFDVPPELTNLLLDFTVSVLLNQPKGDLVEYASDYFKQLLQDRKNGSKSGSTAKSPNDGSSMDDSNHMTEDEEEISKSNVTHFDTDFVFLSVRIFMVLSLYFPNKIFQLLLPIHSLYGYLYIKVLKHECNHYYTLLFDGNG